MKKYLLTTKKQFSTLALGCALVAMATLSLVNCTDPAPPATFTVKFDTNGGTPAIEGKTVEAGKLLAKPATEPAKPDSVFAGWFKDEGFTQRFEFSTEKITQHITLYAKWEDPARVTIPDANFRKKLQALIPKAFVGEKLNATSDVVTRLQFLNVFTIGTDSIKDLTGIHYFTALTTLDCSNSLLVDLDVSKNTALTALHCSNNKLNSLDVSKNAALTVLYCNGNKLNSLDVSKNTALTALYCHENSLTGLDVSKNTALTALYCHENSLTGLDVSKNTALTALYCHENSLTGLDVSKNTALTELYCNSNQLTVLDMSNNTQLTGFGCAGNRLTGLDVSKNIQLTALDCADNRLTALDVSPNTALAQLYCGNNNLTGLDVSKNIQLTALSCAGNRLTGLDVSTNTVLTSLNCEKNLLAHLDMRGMRSVSVLSVLATADETNVINMLKVHVNLKDHAQISAVKTARDDEVKIEIYSAAAKSTTYTAVCNDYDPTVDSEANRCGDEVRYTVTFNSNGGSLVDTLYLYHEGFISKPENPTKTDSTFAGWYNDEALTQAFNFDADKITANTTLYAGWKVLILVSIPDANFRAELQTLIPKAFVGEKLDATGEVVTGLTTLNVNASSIGDMTGIHYFTALTALSCGSNNLTALDVSKNAALTALSCGSNNLTALDVSNNTQLTALSCGSNNLTALDVSNNTQLTALYCDANRLTALDVSNNTQLTDLNCGGNNLSALDVSKNTALKDLLCGSNNLSALDVSNNTQLTDLNCGSNNLSALDVSNNTQLTVLYCGYNRLTALDVSNNTVLTFLNCQKNLLTHLDMRGMRSVQYDGGLFVQKATYTTNAIKVLKVYENLKDHEQISAVKSARGDEVKIETYSAAEGSTAYTQECSDYDPTETDEQDRCKDS